MSLWRPSLGISLVFLLSYSVITPFLGRNDKSSMSGEKKSNYVFKLEEVEPNKTFKFTLNEVSSGWQVTYADFLKRLVEKDDDLASSFIDVLRHKTSFDAYFFETPGVTAESAERQPFEFVLKDASDNLRNVVAEEDAFAEYFSTNCAVAAFANLGGDATLVAPCPTGPSDHYAHLATFVRKGGDDQVRAFVNEVASQMQARLRRDLRRPTWLSTNGLGVYWLHMRLDSRPKYYTYRPYTEFVNE